MTTTGLKAIALSLVVFVAAGCSDFCLSGYRHDDEATRFGRQVLPHFAARLAGQLGQPNPAEKRERPPQSSSPSHVRR